MESNKSKRRSRRKRTSLLKNKEVKLNPPTEKDRFRRFVADGLKDF